MEFEVFTTELDVSTNDVLLLKYEEIAHNIPVTAKVATTV